MIGASISMIVLICVIFALAICFIDISFMFFFGVILKDNARVVCGAHDMLSVLCGIITQVIE